MHMWDVLSVPASSSLCAESVTDKVITIEQAYVLQHLSKRKHAGPVDFIGSQK